MRVRGLVRADERAAERMRALKAHGRAREPRRLVDEAVLEEVVSVREEPARVRVQVRGAARGELEAPRTGGRVGDEDVLGGRGAADALDRGDRFGDGVGLERESEQEVDGEELG